MSLLRAPEPASGRPGKARRLIREGDALVAAGKAHYAAARRLWRELDATSPTIAGRTYPAAHRHDA